MAKAKYITCEFYRKLGNAPGTTSNYYLGSASVKNPPPRMVVLQRRGDTPERTFFYEAGFYVEFMEAPEYISFLNEPPKPIIDPSKKFVNRVSATAQ
jgi:hypothetical protein